MPGKGGVFNLHTWYGVRVKGIPIADVGLGQ